MIKKIIYTRASDGGVSVIIPATREALERSVGLLTEEAYLELVWSKSVPSDAINPRYLEESDLPISREFRDAWVDVTPASTVDIDLAKAKEVQLSKLRAARDSELAKLDKELMIATELGTPTQVIKDQKQALRDVTEPLKALEIDGYNDEAVLQQIRILGNL